MDFRRTILAAGLALLVAAAPVAACLATAHEAPAERAHTGCDPSPDAPGAVLCPGTVIPADGPGAALAGTVALLGASHPGEAHAPEPRAAELSSPAPRARSAPIHLLHATFLI